MFADERGGRQHRPEIRVLGAGDRRRDADDDDVGIGQVRGRRVDDAEPAVDGGAEAIVRDVVDRRPAGVQLRDPAVVRVDPLDLETGLDERDREGQADVAQAEDGDPAVRSVVGARVACGGGCGFGHGFSVRCRLEG